MADSIETLKAETGIEEFDVVLKVEHDLTFALAGGQGDDEHRLTDDDGIWIGPFAHVCRIPAGVYGVTHWNDPDEENPILLGLPDDGPDNLSQDEILTLIDRHQVALWLQAPPDE